MSPDPRGHQQWQPATFAERGVAVPFTTPALEGARARAGSGGIELVVPHPAGARGVYIMTGADLARFCAATLHDRLLAAGLAALPSVTPDTVRAAARAVAAEGAAGRAAAAAAADAAAAARRHRLRARTALLRCLIAQIDGGCASADLDVRGRGAILELAPRLGAAPEQIADDIELLADLYADIGIGADDRQARWPRLADAIGSLLAAVRPLGAACPGQTALAASLVVATGEATLALVRRTLTLAQARLANINLLLADWIAEPARVAAMLARPAWLLDGWEQICLIWELAGPANRRGALCELALVVPALPQEAGTWLGVAFDDAERQRLRKLVRGFRDWRCGGVVFDLIARNEQIRAMAA